MLMGFLDAIRSRFSRTRPAPVANVTSLDAVRLLERNRRANGQFGNGSLNTTGANAISGDALATLLDRSHEDWDPSNPAPQPRKRWMREPVPAALDARINVWMQQQAARARISAETAPYSVGLDGRAHWRGAHEDEFGIPQNWEVVAECLDWDEMARVEAVPLQDPAQARRIAHAMAFGVGNVPGRYSPAQVQRAWSDYGLVLLEDPLRMRPADYERARNAGLFPDVQRANHELVADLDALVAEAKAKFELLDVRVKAMHGRVLLAPPKVYEEWCRAGDELADAQKLSDDHMLGCLGFRNTREWNATLRAATYAATHALVTA